MFDKQLINGALLLKINFFSPDSLSFAALVAVTIAAVLLGASKSLAVNAFSSTIIFQHIIFQYTLTTIYASE